MRPKIQPNFPSRTKAENIRKSSDIEVKIAELFRNEIENEKNGERSEPRKFSELEYS